MADLLSLIEMRFRTAGATSGTQADSRGVFVGESLDGGLGGLLNDAGDLIRVRDGNGVGGADLSNVGVGARGHEVLHRRCGGVVLGGDQVPRRDGLPGGRGALLAEH